LMRSSAERSSTAIAREAIPEIAVAARPTQLQLRSCLRVALTRMQFCCGGNFHYSTKLLGAAASSNCLLERGQSLKCGPR
jgi:hypothetical protein